MTDIDLSTLSREELTKLRKDVEKAIASYDTRKKQEALAAAEAAAKEAGFSLGELLGDGAKGARKKTVNPPKYRHPENPEVTWTGKGRQPDWLKEGLAAGKSLDDFAIQQ